MGPTWGPPGSCRPQMGPMLAPWTLLSGYIRVPNRSVLSLHTILWSQNPWPRLSSGNIRTTRNMAPNLQSTCFCYGWRSGGCPVTSRRQRYPHVSATGRRLRVSPEGLPTTQRGCSFRKILRKRKWPLRLSTSGYINHVRLWGEPGPVSI